MDALRSSSAFGDHLSERPNSDVDFDEHFDNFAPESEWVDMDADPLSPVTDNSHPQSNSSTSSSEGTLPSTRRVYHRQLNGVFNLVELCRSYSLTFDQVKYVITMENHCH